VKLKMLTVPLNAHHINSKCENVPDNQEVSSRICYVLLLFDGVEQMCREKRERSAVGRLCSLCRTGRLCASACSPRGGVGLPGSTAQRQQLSGDSERSVNGCMCWLCVHGLTSPNVPKIGPTATLNRISSYR